MNHSICSEIFFFFFFFFFFRFEEKKQRRVEEIYQSSRHGLFVVMIALKDAIRDFF